MSIFREGGDDFADSNLDGEKRCADGKSAIGDGGAESRYPAGVAIKTEYNGESIITIMIRGMTIEDRGYVALRYRITHNENT